MLCAKDFYYTNVCKLVPTVNLYFRDIINLLFEVLKSHDLLYLTFNK